MDLSDATPKTAAAIVPARRQFQFWVLCLINLILFLLLGTAAGGTLFLLGLYTRRKTLVDFHKRVAAGDGSLRLLRVAWLLERLADWVMQRRQHLPSETFWWSWGQVSRLPQKQTVAVASFHPNAPSRLKRRSIAGYTAFLSHVKFEAAAEARWLQRELEPLLGRSVFLDSDDLRDLTALTKHVRESGCLLLLQSSRVLLRPWCILEIVTAIDEQVPIVGVSLTSGGWAYNFALAEQMMAHLDTFLPGDAALTLRTLGVSPLDAAYKLSSVLPNIISVPLSMNQSRGVLTATVKDIVDAMDSAQRVVRPPLPDRDAWLAGRGEPQPEHVLAATRPPPAALTPAKIPEEVPALPTCFRPRHQLNEALKQSVINRQATASSVITTVTAPPRSKGAHTTTTSGMGGVGKTLSAAALCRDPEIGFAFESICWVSLGQEPEPFQLLKSLHVQLVGASLPDSASEARLALEALLAAAKGRRVLLVLDDVWSAEHAPPLSFVDTDAGSAIVVTTRMRDLMPGAAEIQCDVLSQPEALKVLLSAGGVMHLLESPPTAAIEAVERCGRLPLALTVAGALIDELADVWTQAESGLLDYLDDEIGGSSIEERVVAASLRVAPPEMRAGVQETAVLLSIFPEDQVVPVAALDAVSPLMLGVWDVGEERQRVRQLRRWLKQLIKANLIRGSLEDGVSVHDLIRDCLIRRAEARPGALLGLQRAAVPLLLAAIVADTPAAKYASANLHRHVRSAMRQEATHDDELLLAVIGHEHATVRAQGALAIGAARLLAEADVLDAAGDHLTAARLVHSIVSLRGAAGDREAQRAWASLRRLEATGGGSEASRVLELELLSALLFGMKEVRIGSEEHNDALTRIGHLAKELKEGGAIAEQIFAAEVGLLNCSLFQAWTAEGLMGAHGLLTFQDVEKAHAIWRQADEHTQNIVALAPTATTKHNFLSTRLYYLIMNPRQHILPQFDLEECFGDGHWLRESVERYDFATSHSVAKQAGQHLDNFTFAQAPIAMLFFFGDLAQARATLVKVIAAHKQMLARVRQGEATADGCACAAPYSTSPSRAYVRMPSWPVRTAPFPPCC